MPLTKENVFHEVTHLDYAVRGPIVIRATEIDNDIKTGKKKYPFDQVIFCNVGNPQVLGNGYLTFPRQVMSLLSEPALLDNPHVGKLFPKDVIARAKRMLAETGHTGGYTPANGLAAVRVAIAKAIEERDNANFVAKSVAGKDCGVNSVAGRANLGACNPNDVFLTNGASGAILMALRLLINDPRDGVMCPLPQYPLYTAGIQMYNGTLVPYYLDESHGWGVNVAQLEQSFDRAAELHITPRGLIVINPGNPTGRILAPENMDEILKFCHRRGLLLIADEVYQENIYSETAKFHSFRERLLALGSPYKDEVQIVSLHSTSKGMYGECGRRGGYMQMANFPTDLYDAFLKIPALEMCSNISGQWLMQLMMEPPRPGDDSHALYQTQVDALHQSYKHRALHVVAELNKIRGVKCLPIEGAFYAFARLELPYGYHAHAKKKGMSTDDCWCMELLEMTGLVTLSGTGFGQVPGTTHFRTTIMPRAELMADMVRRVERFQQHVFATYGSTAKL